MAARAPPWVRGSPRQDGASRPGARLGASARRREPTARFQPARVEAPKVLEQTGAGVEEEQEGGAFLSERGAKILKIFHYCSN